MHHRNLWHTEKWRLLIAEDLLGRKGVLPSFSSRTGDKPDCFYFHPLKRHKKLREQKPQAANNGQGRRIWDITDSIKWNNIGIIGVSGKEERERKTEGVLEQIIVEKFLNLGRETGIYFQKVERTPPKINKNRSIPWNIIVKLENFRD